MNNTEPFFSIVVPVYNAGDRIKVMVDGLLSQICQDFEVYFVNDLSTDNSRDYLLKICKKYSHFHYLEMDRNRGAGPARNVGVAQASGQYLLFHDADDWLEKHSLKSLKNHIQHNDFPDMTIFDYTKYNQNGELISKGRKSLAYLPNELNGLAVFKAICNSDINPSVWNKVFKRSSWGDLKFQEGFLFEDIAFIPYACLFMNRVTYCAEATYCYYYFVGGITFGVADQHARAPYSSLIGLYDLLKDLPYFDKLKEDFIRFAFSVFHFNFFYLDRNKNFSDGQLLEYAASFQEFCRQFSIRSIHILTNDKANRLIEALMIEGRFRKVDWGINSFSISFLEMEELLDHYILLSRQFSLAVSAVGTDAAQKAWRKKERKLERKISRLETRNRRLQLNPFYWFGQLAVGWYGFLFSKK